jgi:hypothetical protein
METLMRVSTKGQLAKTLAASISTCLLCSSALAQSGTDGQAAVWTPKEFKFIYQGFTTKYSCDGLQDKVRRILLDLGARKDLVITRWGCAGDSGRPDPFPGVAVKMSVLEPLDAAKSGASEPSLPAHWQNIKLRLDHNTLSEAGECELVEQVKQKILPLFATRNVDYKSTCVPHQLSPGGTQLAADVLIADPAPAQAAPAAS